MYLAPIEPNPRNTTLLRRICHNATIKDQRLEVLALLSAGNRGVKVALRLNNAINSLKTGSPGSNLAFGLRRRKFKVLFY